MDCDFAKLAILEALGSSTSRASIGLACGHASWTVATCTPRRAVVCMSSQWQGRARRSRAPDRSACRGTAFVVQVMYVTWRPFGHGYVNVSFCVKKCDQGEGCFWLSATGFLGVVTFGLVALDMLAEQTRSDTLALRTAWGCVCIGMGTGT